MQVTLSPDVLRWARERAGLEAKTLARKIGVQSSRVDEWERSGRISIVQVDKLAHNTHTPVGYLYLQDPVDDRLPIPDFRTLRDRPLGRPSPDLLETIQTMLRRQWWMRDWLLEEENEPIGFVGSVSLGMNPIEAADSMRTTLRLEYGWADEEANWTGAMRSLRVKIEDVGVLVVINGVVGNNTHRKLNPEEFRGFALVDAYAPLIFINGTDAKAAQMFTLVHELAHIWVGEGGVSNFEDMEPLPHEVEQYCNAVAAEILVPEVEFRSVWKTIPHYEQSYRFLARRFKVSSIVAARRAMDLQLIDRESFFDFYRAWQKDVFKQQSIGKSGGDFWKNQNVRIGKNFGAAVVRAAKEGRLLYRDAYSLTGLKGKTFDDFARKMEEQV